MTGSQRTAVKKKNAGFTLVEIAMVLFIVTLLLTGLVPTISSQLEQQRTNETRKQMDEIQQALLGYAIANGRLPCPAKPGLATGTANAGIEATTGNTCACVAAGNTEAAPGTTECTVSTVTGVLPWVTLGVKETDAWEHRYTYRVTKRFADQIAAGTTDCSPAVTAPTSSSFALCSSGMLNIISASSGGTAVASNVPAVFLSHGKNGAGAYTRQGTSLPVGSSNDEAANSDNNNTFVSHIPTSSFDDMPAWVVPGILFNRMVTAGKLP